MEQVYNCLKVGFENRLTYSQIKIITGYDHRTIRNYISMLREQGYPVISSNKFAGFYIATNDDKGIFDIIRMKQETLSRIKNLQHTVRCCNDFINNYNQETLEI